MLDDTLLQQLNALRDEALVRALTIERTDYEEHFLQAAQREAEQRGLDILAFIDEIETAIDAKTPQKSTIKSGLALLASEWPLWQLRTFCHAFDHALSIQRELHNFLAHYYAEDTYQFSFFVEDQQQVNQLVEDFLHLRLQQSKITPTYDLDRWHLLFKTPSPHYMQKVANALRDADVPLTVQTPVFSRDERGQLGLRVPQKQKKRARQTLQTLENQVRQLYAQANNAYQQQMLTNELKIYAQLVDYGLNNPAVFYNLGGALYESGRYLEAAEAYIEALSLWLSALDAQVHFNSRRGLGGLGGLIGMAGMIVQTALPKNESPTDRLRQLPEYVEDAELSLQRLQQHLPDHTEILRALAATAAVRHDVDEARRRYRLLLEKAPTDPEAQQYLEQHPQQ